MAKRRAKKLTSGGARLIAAGKVPVTLGLHPDQAKRIRAAAARDNRPVTQFFIHHGLAAAEKILSPEGNSP